MNDTDDKAEEASPVKKKRAENIINTGAATSHTAPAASVSTGNTDNASIEKFRAYLKNLYDKAKRPLRF